MRVCVLFDAVWEGEVVIPTFLFVFSALVLVLFFCRTFVVGGCMLCLEKVRWAGTGRGAVSV